MHEISVVGKKKHLSMAYTLGNKCAKIIKQCDCIAGLISKGCKNRISVCSTTHGLCAGNCRGHEQHNVTNSL